MTSESGPISVEWPDLRRFSLFHPPEVRNHVTKHPKGIQDVLEPSDLLPRDSVRRWLLGPWSNIQGDAFGLQQAFVDYKLFVSQFCQST